jgi:hypothetical protein
VFNTLPGGGFLTNGTVQSLIQTGEPAELGWLYELNGVNGPLDFFPNPLALSTYYVTNFSNSNYHSLQLEARRRLQHGFEIQGNYVFSKWLSDSAGTDNFRFEPFLDMNNPKIEKARVPQDLTHQFKLNYSYQLPLGATRYRKFSRVLGGWMTSGNLIWISGNPLSIYSGRGTFLREGYSGVNEASSTLTKPQINDLLGFRMTGNGPYYIAASAINPADGRGVSPDGQPAFNGQVFFNPGPAALGNLQKREFTGPSVFSMDAAIAKDTRFNERVSAQLRLEALNVFNHPAFAIFAQNINSTQFGKITSNATAPRQLQISLKVTF